MEKVSVIIPTKNAGVEFHKTLKGIFSQKLSFPFEVIVVDSGSTDETLSICQEFNVQLLRISPEEFNHGKTRNYAIEKSKGDFIAFIVQDAIPYDENWLGVLIENLAKDSKVAGVCSKHVPKEDSSALIRFLVNLWHKDLQQRKERVITELERFDDLPSEEKRRFAYFSNVSSAIRKEVWKKFPFLPLPYAEDLEWSLRVLKAGYKIVYDPASIVYHSHDRSVWYEFNRAILEGDVFSSIFGTVPEQKLSPKELLLALEKILREINTEKSILNYCKTSGKNLSFEYVSELNIYSFFKENFDLDVLKILLGRGSPLKHHEKEWLLKMIEGRLHGFTDMMGEDILTHIFDMIWFDINKDLVIWASIEAHKDDIVFMILKDILFFTEFVIKNIEDMDWDSYQHMRLYVATTILGRQLGHHNRGKFRPKVAV